MTLGQGAPITQSRKQRLNTKSSTTAELVAGDDVSTLILARCVAQRRGRRGRLPRLLQGMLRFRAVPSVGQYVRTMGRPIYVTRAARTSKKVTRRVRRYRSS